MRKRIFLAAVIVCTATLVRGQDKANFATVAGPHNIGTFACLACHIPHKKTAGGDNGAVLLWANQFASEPGPSYNTYTGLLGFADGAPITEPATGAEANAHSYVCLSCHDGTAAGINFGLTGYLNGETAPSGDQLVVDGTDTDLSNDHPVGFIYPDDATVAGTNYNTHTLVSASSDGRLSPT